MTIESRDLIISVSVSRNDYYKPENLNECCITTEIQHTFKTLKNPESESVFPVSYESYTASHNDVLFISKATKKNDFNSGTVVKEEYFVPFPFLRSGKRGVTTHGSREVVTW